MAPEEVPAVLTIGYGDKTLAELLDALSPYEVDLVVDVRSLAESTVEGFSQDELIEALGGRGIDYAHLGELGDFQPEAYPDYMETEAWAEGFDQLLSFTRKATCCLLCKCPDVSTCHRRFLQQRLQQAGHKVVHITPAGPREAVTLDQT